MKTTQRCPKCDGRHVWVIEPFRTPSEDPRGAPLPVVPHQGGPRTALFQFERRSPVGRLDLYVCGSCGYAELWAEGTRELRADPANGVRLLDTNAAPEGPFR